jgi:hypothetical protein
MAFKIVVIYNSAITQHNEAIVLESFIQIFCMTGTHFQSFRQFQKIIN